MANAKKGRSHRAPKSPKKADGPVVSAFRVKGKSAPKAAAAAPATVTQPKKVQTAGFLSYLCTKSSNSELSNMACVLQQKCGQLDQQAKKAMVQDFFRSGGKKQGLMATYSQAYRKTSVQQLQWAGWLCDLWNVDGDVWGEPVARSLTQRQSLKKSQSRALKHLLMTQALNTGTDQVSCPFWQALGGWVGRALGA